MIPPDAVKNAASGGFFISAAGQAKVRRQVGEKGIRKKKKYFLQKVAKSCVKNGEYGTLYKYTCVENWQ